MAAPNGAILFNNSTGSDTTASGLGAANVYGSGASTTGSSAVVTGIDTTGVSSGDLLWVQSSSGRQFSIIATVDSSTQVTCDDTFANTESGRTWAIGGKRATFDNADSRRIFENDNAGDWTIRTETDQSLTSTITLKGNSTTTSLNTLEGSEYTKTITQTANTPIFTSNGYASGYWHFRNLKLQNTNATKTNANGYTQANSTTLTPTFTRCVFGDATNTLKYGFVRTGGWASFNINKCHLTNCETAIYSLGGSGEESFLIDSVIENSSSDGILWVQAPNLYMVNLVIANNSGIGLNRSSNLTYIKGCFFISNSSHGVSSNSDLIIDSVFDSNGGYGISGTPKTVIGNAFRNNTSGDMSSGSDRDPITLTADPFVDAAAGDFNLNADAGGGALLRANNYALNTDTSLYPFRQYVSDDFGGGGGNVIVIEE